jgi:XTP/dITP diphosphohydrolase
MQILVATTNPGKQKEFISLLENSTFEIVTPDTLELHLEVEETGSTYVENASLKAMAFAKASRMLVIADDTGLEVEALDGRPGLYSARYSAIEGATDADRRRKLLAELTDKPRPWKAKFTCVVALCTAEGNLTLFDGTVGGEIIPEEGGDYGFGYDRIFWIPTAGKRMAELTLKEKNRYSHRAIAVNKVLQFLESQAKK